MPIHLAYPRNRTTPDFQAIRQKVLSEFEKTEDLEYAEDQGYRKGGSRNEKGLIVLVTVFSARRCGANGASGDHKPLKEIRIGIQQSLSPLLIAKEKGWFEDAFEKEGIKVKWVEFQSGPPQFEGLAADKLDFLRSAIRL